MEFKLAALGVASPDVRSREKAYLDHFGVETRQAPKLQEDVAIVQPSCAKSSFSNYFAIRQAVVSYGMAAEETFSSFYCPITLDVMDDPVTTCGNHTYERSAIQRWFDEGHSTDPCTMDILVDTELTPNRYLQQTISEWRERYCLIQILKAKDNIQSPNEAEQLQILEKLLDICDKVPCSKDWVNFEDLMPQIIECSRSRSCDVKRKTFALLRVLVTDHDKNKEAVIQEAVTVGGCLEVATGSLLREPPLLQAAEFLRELVNSCFVRTKLSQQQPVMVALVTSVMTLKDAAVKDVVLSILEKLSDEDEIVKQMARANWCTPLLERLCRGSEEAKVPMVVAVAEMTLTEKNVESFISHDVISVLIKMTQSSSQDVANSAIQALWNLSSHEIALFSMVEGGLISHILESFSPKTSLTFKVAAAAILEKLLSKYGMNFIIQTCGEQTGLPELVHVFFHLLGNLTFQVSTTSLHGHLLKILYEMALSPDSLELGQLIRDEQGCLEVLLILLKPKVPEVCVLALKLLCVICSGKGGTEMAALLNKEVKPIIVLLEDDSATSEIHYAVAEILSKLPDDDSRSFGSRNALSTLLKMSTVSSEDGKTCAVGALLRYTKADANFQQFLVERDFLPILVDMLSSSSSLLRSRAALALKNFSLSSPQLVCGQKRQSLAFLSPWKICPLHSVRCTVKKTFCIVEAGAVPKLVVNLEDTSSEVAEAAVDALLTFLQPHTMIINGAHVLHNFGAVEKLLHLATGKSLTCSVKSLELLEKIFSVAEIKKAYTFEARKVFLSLTGCQQSQSLSCKAVKMLSE